MLFAPQPFISSLFLSPSLPLSESLLLPKSALKANVITQYDSLYLPFKKTKIFSLNVLLKCPPMLNICEEYCLVPEPLPTPEKYTVRIPFTSLPAMLCKMSRESFYKVSHIISSCYHSFPELINGNIILRHSQFIYEAWSRLKYIPKTKPAHKHENQHAIVWSNH